MRAIIVDDDKNMNWAETQTPEPGRGEVRIRVQATAINRADLMQRRGLYPPPPGASTIMGLECAGVIDAVGEGVDRWRPGDAVCALLGGGGYAEYAIAAAGSVLPVPAGLSAVEAASLPEVYATAWLNMFMDGALKPGERVILHAGGSGVGTAGIELCKAFGNPCFVTVGNDDKLRRCLSLGAGAGANRHAGSFLEPANRFAEGHGYDLILDPVGGAYLKDNINLLALNGRLALIGLMSGGKTEIDLAPLLFKRLRIIGSTLRTRPNDDKARIMASLEQHVWPRIGAGQIKPVIDCVMPIQEAAQAHDLVASDNTFGKVVLSI